MAEAIFRDIVTHSDYSSQFEIDSAGTAGYHIGKIPDRRTLEVLAANEIETNHLAQKLGEEDLDIYDHLVVMDEANFEHVHNMYHTLKHMPPPPEKVFLIRDYDPEVRGVQEVPDPYYGGKKEFKEVYDVLRRSCEALFNHLIDFHMLVPEKEDE